MNTQKTLTMVTKALSFAACYHATQKRKSDNSPYINHLIEVLDLLANVHGVECAEELCVGVLHDIIEDSDIDEIVISEHFGENTLSMVKGLSDDKTQSLETRRSYTIRKLGSTSDSLCRIKLADITSNASAIPTSWDEKRLLEYFTWLDEVAKVCRPASEALYQEYVKRRAKTV